MMCGVNGWRFTMFFQKKFKQLLFKLSTLTYRKSVFKWQQIANISQSITHKMVAKTSWHRYGTKLRHCHPMYRVGQKNRTVFRLDNFVTVSPRKACSMSKFSKFYQENRYKTRISVRLNVLCQICSNRHNSWNYGIYDQNTWILLNLH